MNEAEYDEIESDGGELDFAESDSLPWLESDEDDAAGGGVDKTQMIAFLALLAMIGFGVVGAVYFVSNYNRGPVAVPDGSLIEAPEGPYKERPAQPGGKRFAGTDDVAPGIGQGRAPDGRLAEDTGAGSGDQDLNVAMPPIDGAPGESAATAPATSASSAASSSASPARSAAADSAVSGVGVQVGAYSSRAGAQKGWRTLQGQSEALAKLQPRILEGEVERTTVFRLQAVAPSLSEAKSLCATLRQQGIDCQVKP